MYVAALLAAAEMAEAMGETDFAEKCERLGRDGAALHRRQAVQRPLVRPEDRPLRQGRARRRSTPAATPACSPTASWRPTGRTSTPSSSTRWAKAASPTRSSASGTPRSPASAASSTPARSQTALKAVHANNFRPTLGGPFQPLPQLRLRGRRRPAGRDLPRRHPPADGRRALCRGGLDRRRIHVGLAHDHARPGRRGPRRRARRARPPRRRAPQSLERHRMRLLLRPLDVGLAAGQRLVRPAAPTSSPAASASRQSAKGDYRAVLVGRHRLRPARSAAATRSRSTVLGGSLDVAEIAVDGRRHRSPTARRSSRRALTLQFAPEADGSLMAGDRTQGRPQKLPGARGHPRHRPRGRRRRLHRLRRPLRLRQVHPAAHDRRARRGHLRRDPHRRHALRPPAARRRAAWRWCSSPTRSTRT